MKLRFEPHTDSPLVGLVYATTSSREGRGIESVGGTGCVPASSEPLQKCTEYWPEEQVVYDGMEITIRKVIHTEDYRLRLISLRVRPGAGRMGLGSPEPTGPLKLK